MFDSRSRVIRMITYSGVLLSIKGQPHRLISDRMRKNLQAPTIKFCHGLCVLRGIPKQLASLTWVVTIRREHGRRVRFDYAVQHGLNHTARNPVIVISATSLLYFFDRVRSQLWRVEKVGNVKTQGQLAVAAQLVVKIEPLEILSGAVHAREPEFVGLVASQAQCGKTPFTRVFGHDSGD